MDEATREVLGRWLNKAEDDLKTARIVMDAVEPVTDSICFHAQQCMEKALKAYLVFRNIHVDKTHDLLRLLGACAARDPTFRDLRQAAENLTEYAVRPRYPDEYWETSFEEAKEAFQQAEKALLFVKTKVV